MKFTLVLPALLVTISAVAAAALPNEDGKPLADGYYRTYIGASGESITEFTPLSELINATETPVEARSAELQDRHSLQKRRQGCGGYVSTYDSDHANVALLNTFSRNDVEIVKGDKRAVSIFSNTHTFPLIRLGCFFFPPLNDMFVLILTNMHIRSSGARPLPLFVPTRMAPSTSPTSWARGPT